jgi:hypothetical protein
MPYSEWSGDGFMVRFDDQIWEWLDNSYVEAMTPEREAKIRGVRLELRRSARATRKAS